MVKCSCDYIIRFQVCGVMRTLRPLKGEEGHEVAKGFNMIDYNSQLNQRAKTLRRNMTPWERKLWYTFLRTYPIKFYRQRIIGNYIADFYCSEAKLVIELDGGGHYQKSQREYDEFRTRVLQAKGFSVLRFSNLDVDKNFYGVCTEIDKVVKQLTPQSATLTAPLTGGRE